MEETFTFPSADGKTMIHALRWIPEDGKYHAVLQITHGMIEFIERYRDFAEFLNQKGILVVGHDHLGHGDSVNSKKDWGYFAEKNPSDTVIADMHTLRRMMQSDYPRVPYFMLGHSMGSYMLRKYLCIHPEHLQGALIMGTGYIKPLTVRFGLTLCAVLAKMHGWHYRSRIVEMMSFAGPYKRYDLTGKDTTNCWLSRDENMIRFYYSQPKCTFHFTLNGYKGLLEAVLYDGQQKNLRTLPKDLPLVILSGADDPVGNFGKGVKRVFEMYRDAGITDISCKIYKNNRHEILNEVENQVVYQDIYAWIEKHVK